MFKCMIVSSLMIVAHIANVFFFQNLLSSVVERAPIIEQVNLNGGRFIREGKVRFGVTSSFAMFRLLLHQIRIGFV